MWLISSLSTWWLYLFPFQTRSCNITAYQALLETPRYLIKESVIVKNVCYMPRPTNWHNTEFFSILIFVNVLVIYIKNEQTSPTPIAAIINCGVSALQSSIRGFKWNCSYWLEARWISIFLFSAPLYDRDHDSSIISTNCKEASRRTGIWFS